MKVLITGATGLVGSELVSQCHEKGYTVNYLTTSKNKIVSDSNYQGYFWNPDTAEIDKECLNGVSVIINLAGASISKRWTEDYKKVILRSRINSLELLKITLQNTINHTVTSIVSASAIGIYPDSLSDYYTEDEKNVDDSFLGEVVVSWENKVDEFKPLGLTVAKVRIGLVMSNDGGALPEMTKPVKFFVGAAFGSGEQWQSWIHISDLAGIFLYAITNELEGIYNGVAPNPVTNNKLVKEIAKNLHRPLFLPNIPKFIMHTILGDMAYILFASQRVSSKKIEEEGYIFQYANICHALADIFNKENKCVDSKTKITKELMS
ncbi:TIGR01777 family oxidoreductase [Maribacter sp. ACAM166]|uniref:TIGR01777 family oxidoreductase n=1 Tax=Maribacter sp. ACAM166 TaxID=2508996 RepID=UPI0010FE029A|nr:TIGR01777 family oxidoreductase [Maribacter sp. ACAM166]TLP80438.1 TIGR01777 family protein [Maribacter sp. ACAM166]